MPKQHRNSVAPKDLIRNDFAHLKEKHQLCTTAEIEDLILIQSIEGHAHQGHSVFKGKRYVDTTMDDIVEALGWDEEKVKLERQNLIDEIFEFFKRVISGERVNRLVNVQGQPLLGVSILLGLLVNPEDILRGFYLGGNMDNPERRKEVEAEYNIQIGGGQCYLVDIDVMHQMGLDGYILAHGNHEGQLNFFRQKGLIVSAEEAETLANRKLRYMYIRHRVGGGVSDDAAIVSGGLLFGHNKDISLGVFLADAIDTLDKYSSKTIEGGQDEHIARYISDNFGNLNVSPEQLKKFIFFAAIPEELKDRVPDSSLRHLIEYDRHSHLTALQSHLAYVQKKRFPKMDLAFERISNLEFYRYVEARFRRT